MKKRAQADVAKLKIRYPQIGICGLSCLLCPRHNTESASKCDGCKTESRMAAGCPFITCAIKRKGVEFCWQCEESSTCAIWKKHRESGRKHDTFISYSKLETDIAFIQNNNFAEHYKQQLKRSRILSAMLDEFNDGKSKNFYCIAVTILEIQDLEKALLTAAKISEGEDIKSKSIKLHALLSTIAQEKGLTLSLRKN